jgi:4-oxalocrotonate tautomerase
MPIIEVTMIEGRSKEKKAALMRALTDATENAIGVPRPSIRVILREVPAEHFAVGGVSKAETAGKPKKS